MTAFELGQALWIARTRAAWGGHADTIMARTPWPPHASHPDRAEAHDLAIAEAKAILKAYDVSPKP